MKGLGKWHEWVLAIVLLGFGTSYLMWDSKTTPSEVWDSWKAIAHENPLVFWLAVLAIIGIGLTEAYLRDWIRGRREGVIRLRWPLIFPILFFGWLTYSVATAAIRHETGARQIATLALAGGLLISIAYFVFLAVRGRRSQ